MPDRRFPFGDSIVPRIILVLLWTVWMSAAAAPPDKTERHVVVVVWDGMRPDFVNEQNTPALWKLACGGVSFHNHHSVYPSATMVNGTAIVTGAYPGKNGIIANHVYRPDIEPRHAIDVEVAPVVEKGDELSGGNYIATPTIGELLQRIGARSVIATAKTVGLLLDRQIRAAESGSIRQAVSSPTAAAQGDAAPIQKSVTLFAGQSLPRTALASITKAVGPFPSAHLQSDSWTTKALLKVLWKNELPAFSVLWLGEPDLTQHEAAPGAPTALAAIKSADENLALVLSALDDHKARETTDLFVVSDHGFSTIRRSIDLRKILNEAGFTATTEFGDKPKPGDIMLAGNGGSVLFYVIGHDPAVTSRLVELLQQSNFAGVIFTKQPAEGTFELEQAKIENKSAPDVLLAFRWYDLKNQFGIPGMIDADWQRTEGKGTHATLSRFDMHNTLVATGPDFKRGETDNLATGNLDLAPTILQILGVKAPPTLDGRILSEAMINVSSNDNENSEIKTIEATKHFPSGTWRQTLQISRVGSTIYLDQGTGAFVGSRAIAQ
ncbi:MAG TPA: alkaline phosphatase family protein [Candidatus Udaeobacter sp.]|jgi:arylsulfatase A-like enzyme|nr:alkaline phosphatase family protein [Candidatus Udaeobacter sp.]